MKILELTNYSGGACGVWARVREESIRLKKKGHEILVISSNSSKGNKDILSKNEVFKGIHILRMPYNKLGGEGFMNWPLIDEALNFSPDIIIAHNYRHPHTLKALKVAKILRKRGKNCKVFLVTHAPFVEGNITRTYFN